MEIIAAILIFMQIFTVFSSVKKGLDIRDIKNGNDDRLVFYRDNSSLGIFLWINFFCWVLEFFMIAVGVGIYAILIIGPFMILVYRTWLGSILIYDKEKIVFPYYSKKNRIIYYKDIDYLEKKRRRYRGGYDGKHLYSYYFVWHWSMSVKGRIYSIGEDSFEDGHEKYKMFLNTIQNQYQTITGNELRIEQILGHYDEE